MKITEYLTTEHRVFTDQLVQIEKALEDRDRYPDAAVRAMVEMLAAPLERHARTKDEVFFPALETYLEGTDGPLAVMGAEHEKIRQALAALVAGQDVRELTLQLLEVLRGHIHKENRVLFPMAEEFLGPEELSRLAEASHVGH